MADQANAVESNPDADLIAALGGATVEGDEVEDPEFTEVDQETTEEPEAEEPAEETKAETYKVTVKNDAGQDEEREVTLDDLAKGYMLQADYTRKTQESARKIAETQAEYQQALAKTQQSAVEQISQLQELVIQQAAPELNGVDWVALSVQDPAKFVQLQARQQQLNNTYQALEQRKTQLQREHEQRLEQSIDHALRQSDELLTKSIKDFNGEKAAKLLQDVEKHVGWKSSDIKAAAKAMAAGGLNPQVLGQVLLLAHDAIQFRTLQTTKAKTLEKVAAAPKVLKPSAPQPKRTNQAALDRLKKSGRVEDLAAFL